MIRTRKEVREVECIETIECDRCKREVRTDDEDWIDRSTTSSSLSGTAAGGDPGWVTACGSKLTSAGIAGSKC
ncbi:MAG: hypothetical protein IPG33_11255 [Betaproteobacteria bacterium]|nr:hypothetical protein [Betaproteobacteria bacterium]